VRLKLWSDPRINSRTLVRIRGLEARKGELQLRTCVYSRYASSKTKLFTGFCRSQATSGLAVDYRQSQQNNGFCRRKAAAANHVWAANKNHHFLNLED